MEEIIQQIISGEIDMDFLGKGSNGEAYQHEDFVIKFTNSKGEIECAKRLMELQNENPDVLKYTAKIHKYSQLTGEDNDNLNLSKPYEYILITDYLITSKSNQKKFARNIFGKIFGYCFENNLSLTSVIENSKNHIFEDEDCNTLLKIFAIEKFIGAQDLHSGNLGYDSNKNLKGFDFDFIVKK